MCNVCVCLNIFIIHEYIYIRICVNSQPPSCQKNGECASFASPAGGEVDFVYWGDDMFA